MSHEKRHQLGTGADFNALSLWGDRMGARGSLDLPGLVSSVKLPCAFTACGPMNIFIFTGAMI